MIIYVNDYDVGIEALPTPTITLLMMCMYITQHRCNAFYVETQSFRKRQEYYPTRKVLASGIRYEDDVLSTRVPYWNGEKT